MSSTPVIASLLTILGAAGILLWTRHAAASEPNPSRTIRIVVDGGYSPSRIDAHEGEVVRLEFLRKDASACASEVVFPSLNIRRALPVGRPEAIVLPPLQVGEVRFECGMHMLRGTIVVHPKGHAHH